MAHICRYSLLYMSNKQHTSSISFFGNQLYFFVALVASIPIYLAINPYVKSIHVSEDEAVTSAATAFFIVGIFAGRYLALVWFAGAQKVSTPAFAGNVFLITASTGWLFFHADFPLKDRAAINLVLFWIPFIIISLGTGVLIKMIRLVSERRLQAAQAEAAQHKTELQLLQSQLSPHFLFNTLNNMYGLSITQNEKVPALILKLSELLRYSVYEANETFVPLKEEITYLNNYIDFERLRLGDRLQLTVAMEEVSGDMKIAPMLLIVFIENAFKHAKNTAEQKIYIDIELKTWHSSILFAVKNSYSKTGSATATGKNSGFGLASVYKRLDLLYNDRYDLAINNEDAFYNVTLQLKTPV